MRASRLILAVRDCEWCGDAYTYHRNAGGSLPQRCATCTGYATAGVDLHSELRATARILKDLLLVKKGDHAS